jgi:hypothetical protein
VEDSLLTIGAVARLSGLPVSALRFYDAVHADHDWRALEPAPPPHRVPLDGPAFRAAVAAGPATRTGPTGPCSCRSP